MIKEIPLDFLASPELLAGAILHTHEPFVKDYLTLHILLKIHKPKSVLEIGTHIGEGTNIICNALPEAKVFTLDLPISQFEKSAQHPLFKSMNVGEMCKKSYAQLWGDSMEFDYSKFLCEAWFIDGEHDYAHPFHETLQAIKQKAKLIIWHDADITKVGNAINDAFANNDDYYIYSVTGTRIAYALRK